MGGVFASLKLGQPRRVCAGSADAPDGIAVVGFVEDDVVLVPGAAAGVGCVGENGHGSAGGGDFLEVAVGEKADGLSIGRPEREAGTLGVVEFPGREFVQGLHPDGVTIFSVTGAEHDRCSVRGDSRGAGEIAGEVVAGFGRRRQIRTQDLRWLAWPQVGAQ